MNKLESSKRFWSLVIFVPLTIAILWCLLGVFGTVLGFTTLWEEDFELYDIGYLTVEAEKWVIHPSFPNDWEYYFVSDADSFNGAQSGYSDNIDTTTKIIQYIPGSEISSRVYRYEMNLKQSYWRPGGASYFGFTFVSDNGLIKIKWWSDSEHENNWWLGGNNYIVDCSTGNYIGINPEMTPWDSDTFFEKNVWGKISIKIDFANHIVKLVGNNGVEDTDEVCHWFNNTKSDVILSKMYFRSAWNRTFFDYFYTPEIEEKVWVISPDFESGLSALWRFDEGTGSTAYDTSGNENTGTLENMGEEDWVEGVVETALDFDGDNDHVDIAPTFLADLTTGSICFWAKIDTDDANNNFVFSISNNASDTSTEMWINLDCRTDNDFFGVALTVDDTIQWYFKTAVDSLDAYIGNWAYLCLTQDGTIPKFYINEIPQTLTWIIEIDKTKWLKAILTDATTDADVMSIGCIKRNGVIVSPFDGKVDEVRLYSSILTDNQISSLHKNPGGEITDLSTIFEFGWEDLDTWDTLLIAFENRPSGIFSEAEVFDIETIGTSGSMELTFEDFNFDRSGKFYFYSVASKEELETIEDMFLTGGYSYAWTSDLVDPEHWYIITIEELAEIFEMVDFETWYEEFSKFATPTAMFNSIAGFFDPIFNYIGEFGNRIKDYFNVDEAHAQGYEIGKTIPYFTFFVAQVGLFLGGFPILKWVFVVILLLVGIFIFRLIMKFIPFLGG